MKYRILSNTDKQLFGANVAVTVDYTDLNVLASGATGSIKIAPYNGATNTLAAGTLIACVGFTLSTAFVVSDGGNTLAITLGDGGSATRYMASTETLGAATEIIFSAGTGTRYALTSADNVILAIAAQAAHDVTLATAGSMTFYLRIDDMTTFVVP